MKLKISHEELKSWIIILLVLGLITSLAYYYIYPYILTKSFKSAGTYIFSSMMQQLDETGKIKIQYNDKYIVLITEEKCNETFKK